MPKQPTNRQEINDLSAQIAGKLTDEGKLIEAGWVMLRAMSVPKDAPQIQVDEMRNAFFAGAQHLFGSIMNIMDPDSEPTEKDMQRMSHIDMELRQFIQAYKAKHGLS